MRSRYVSSLLIFIITGPLFAANQHAFSGAAALEATRKAVAYGERPSGSQALSKLRGWIVAELKPLGGQLSLDSFTGETPTGPVPMTNIILKFAGSSGKSIAVTGHYDTAPIPMVRFVGANDGGSSTGFLLEFAKAMSKMKHPDDIYVVFFDGEEARVNWTATDSLYGSRHLVAKWGADGTLARIKALINVDMIGDKQLNILNDGNSSQALRDIVLKAAKKLNDGQYFETNPSGIDDDHIPFVNAGVNAVDLIDYDFGPHNSYWHTAQDTMDKLSAQSLQVVGDVVMATVKELEQ